MSILSTFELSERNDNGLKVSSVTKTLHIRIPHLVYFLDYKEKVRASSYDNRNLASENLASEKLASGKPFLKIFSEVNKDLCVILVAECSVKWAGEEIVMKVI